MKPLAQWPLEERRRIRGVLSDIDDTLTTHGRLTPDVLAALDSLRAAGLQVVAVTGRPTWWAMPLLRLCGFDAVIAENGASAFWLDQDGVQRSWFYADAATRVEHRHALEAFVPALRERFPQLHVVDDAMLRVGDMAFDVGESVPPMPCEEVDAIVAFIRSCGFYSTVSSIHVHASVAQFSKQETTQRILSDVFHVNDALARDSYVFVGDSGNDAPMFAHYPHSVGVANVLRHMSRLTDPPAWIAPDSCGAGFVQVAQALLQARQ
ncbi:MAG TPA: HAD-IIB family hydrolase [Noviherbaspirillum sp.]|uniref:HAD family hydrolase n=1 Tax=Noviherbaspirillum sp. TaxID=1926288 RepID=UPI002B49F3B9|nr:HAD-IIB family hydrolase [Noviherbaspirillum sp.]HJV85510.1 HAD-IIB family hydrolase [Noviherbaspirillum sp.]